MSSGVTRMMTGALIGTGANVDVRTVGFRPRKVQLVNIVAPDTLMWTDSMADAAGLKEVAAGTISMISSGGVTPLSDGFRLGTDSDMNVDTQKVHWVAWE